MENIGEKIKNIREIRNYSQSFVAKKTGMSQSNYAKIETGKIHIKPKTIEIIASILETSPAILKNFDSNIFINKENNIDIPKQLIQHFMHTTKEILLEEKALLEKKLKIIESVTSF